jgi:hypothetical protein
MLYEPVEAALAVDPQVLAADRPPSELARAIIAVGLHWEAVGPAEDACLRLAGHPDAIVRGNALLGPIPKSGDSEYTVGYHSECS